MTQTIAAPRDVIAERMTEKLSGFGHGNLHKVLAAELADIATNALAEAGYRIVRDEPVAWWCTDLIMFDQINIVTCPEHAASRARQPDAWRVEPLFAPLKETDNGG